MDFYEKALLVNGRRGTAVWLTHLLLSALRAMLLSAVNTLWVVGRGVSDRPDPSIRRTAYRCLSSDPSVVPGRHPLPPRRTGVA
jgi:hypothetical protein